MTQSTRSRQAHRVGDAHPGLVPTRHDYARGFEDGLARAKARVERVAEAVEDLGVRGVLLHLTAELVGSGQTGNPNPGRANLGRKKGGNGAHTGAQPS